MHKKPLLISTLVIIILFLVGAFVLKHFLFDSAPIKAVINVLNNNDRVAAYLGTKVTSQDISNQNIHFTSDANDVTTSDVTFTLPDIKNSVTVTANVTEDHNAITVNSLTLESKGQTQEFMNLTLTTSLMNNEELTGKNTLTIFSEVLNSMQKQSGHLVLTRSEKNNDFIQVYNLNLKDQPCLVLEYSEGYTPENKQIYRADGGCQTSENVLEALTSYARGTDDFKKLLNWKQLKSINTNDKGDQEFVY